MYVSGVIVAFILSFIIFFIQGIQRQRDFDSDETMIKTIGGALFGSVLAAGLSWLIVVILILMLLNGKVSGISDRNI